MARSSPYEGIVVADIGIDTLLAIVNRHLIVDGYYTKDNETHLRCSSRDEVSNDWSTILSKELKPYDLTLKKDQNGNQIYLNIYPAKQKVPWLNILLFVLTYFSISFIPALITDGSQVFTDSSIFLEWQKFAIPLLLILLFHEFGHYLAARRRGIRVSLPYFIPAPTYIGTFGAVIKSKSPFPNRRDLLEVGASGPIAGFIIAVIFLTISLSDLTYREIPPYLTTGTLIDPLIVHFIEFLVNNTTPQDGYGVFLQDNKILFASWVGLIVTMINLLPVGQLDGGHVMYALIPRKHKQIGIAMFIMLIGLGFLWQGWWLLAILQFLIIKFHHPPTLNDSLPISKGSKILGWLAIIIFILTFTPVPFF